MCVNHLRYIKILLVRAFQMISPMDRRQDVENLREWIVEFVSQGSHPGGERLK